MISYGARVRYRNSTSTHWFPVVPEDAQITLGVGGVAACAGHGELQPSPKQCENARSWITAGASIGSCGASKCLLSAWPRNPDSTYCRSLGGKSFCQWTIGYGTPNCRTKIVAPHRIAKFLIGCLMVTQFSKPLLRAKWIAGNSFALSFGGYA